MPAEIPVSWMTPLKVVLALESVSVLLPKATVPAPDKVTIDAPEVVPEISNVPLAATLDDDAIAPEVLSAKVAPLLTIVAPV